MAEGIPVKLVIRRIGIAVIGVGTLGVIVSNSAGAVGGSRYTDMAFPTPEAAIQHYTKGVSQGDAAAIFESFSIQKYAEKFDFVSYTDRLQAMELDRTLLPATSPMFKQLNEALRASLLAGQVRTLIFSMISSQAENVQTGGGIIQADRAKASDFVASLDVKKLSILKIAKIVEIPAKNSAIFAKSQKNEAAQAKITGADEQREYLVLYQLGATVFKGGITAQRYGTTWTIVTLTAPLSGLPANGAVQKSSLADFDKSASEFG